MDSAEIWKQALADLKKEVSSPNFITFFKPAQLLSLDKQRVVIGLPSQIVLSMAQKRFLSLFEDILRRHTGSPLLQVELVVAQKTETEPLDPTPLFAPAPTTHAPIAGHLPRVRAEYTFETLAVSASNQLAYVSAQTVSKHMGKSYNPLFIYGPVGVGKTHLMQAIANAVYHDNPQVKVIYITSEEFTNEVVDAIRSADTARMKKRFRSANLLIIDDVQFIAGKDKVQEELFHTFNALIDAGGQIVLSSDRPPSEIKKLEARLSSRFAGGLTVDVESPDFEMRTAIILKKAEKYNFPIDMETAKAIAEREQDVRSLEGALLQVMTHARQKNTLADASFASRVLNHEQTTGKKPVHADDIINIVCAQYAIKPTQLKGPKRDAGLVKARQIAMWLLFTELKLTYAETGNILGGRDHTTVMHGVQKVENMRGEISTFAQELKGITTQIWG
jgi:chromosomal replication initiator protein